MAITGLRENFGTEDGVEEPYRGPSSESQVLESSQKRKKKVEQVEQSASPLLTRS